MIFNSPHSRRLSQHLSKLTEQIMQIQVNEINVEKNKKNAWSFLILLKKISFFKHFQLVF
jgi:hypothetical protein